jgi:ketosteroid isomerase-like protein
VSQENVEIVRRLYEAAARRDTESLLSLYDPEVEWVFSRQLRDQTFGWGTYRGHEGLRTFFREQFEAFHRRC